MDDEKKEDKYNKFKGSIIRRYVNFFYDMLD